jgi:hypothetical protein
MTNAPPRSALQALIDGAASPASPFHPSHGANATDATVYPAPAGAAGGEPAPKRRRVAADGSSVRTEPATDAAHARFPNAFKANAHLLRVQEEVKRQCEELALSCVRHPWRGRVQTLMAGMRARTRSSYGFVHTRLSLSILLTTREDQPKHAPHRGVSPSACQPGSCALTALLGSGDNFGCVVPSGRLVPTLTHPGSVQVQEGPSPIARRARDALKPPSAKSA